MDALPDATIVSVDCSSPTPLATPPLDQLRSRFLLQAAGVTEPDANGRALLINDLAAADEFPTYEAHKILMDLGKRNNVDGVELIREYKKRRNTFSQAVRHAVPPEQHGDCSANIEAAWALCRHIAESPRLVDDLLSVVCRLGVAGDRGGVFGAYLVAISRLLQRPVAMLRKGAAASGKNFIIDKGVLPLLNKSDYVILTAGSAKALLYTGRDFRHTLLIIPEAAALTPSRNGSDEFAMMIRELISSGRLEYATVQPVGQNGALQGVVISKEGPVAFIVTTARENIEEELFTRLLVTTTDESDRQTETILKGIATNAAGGALPPPAEEEITAWRAFQDWLRLGRREVVVPFAPQISELVNRRAMRIRRDFPNVISLVMASALMHRAQRQTDASGHIIATPQDYGYAVAVLGEGLEELAHGDTAAIDAVRDQIAAEQVRQGLNGAVEVSTHKLGVLLGIGRQAARTRLDNAIEAGAVIDVGIGVIGRARTAPKLLLPGAATRHPPGPSRTRGAFPSLAALQDRLHQDALTAAQEGGRGAETGNQATKGEASS